MLKKKVIPIQKTTIGLKCGDCMHYKRTPKFEKPCAILGVRHYANAPSCFSPDVFQLSKQEPELLSRFGMWVKDLGPKETRILMAILKRHAVMQKSYSLKFGQPVYFFFGQSYLSNFFRGYVVSTGEAGEDQVYITSDLNKKQRKNPMMVTMPRASVYTIPQFKKLRDKLVKDNRIQDPNPLFTPVKAVVDPGYTIPSLESAPKFLLDKSEKSTAKKGVKGAKKLKMPDHIKKEVTGELTFKVRT